MLGRRIAVQPQRLEQEAPSRLRHSLHSALSFLSVDGVPTVHETHYRPRVVARRNIPPALGRRSAILLSLSLGAYRGR